MAKAYPWDKWFWSDWFADEALVLCSHVTISCWSSWLGRMHQRERCGELRGTSSDLARLVLAATTPEEAESALVELRDSGAADVERDGDQWVLINRRMNREHRKRVGSAERMTKSRQRRKPGVTSCAPLHDSCAGGKPDANTAKAAKPSAKAASPESGKAPGCASVTPEKPEAISQMPDPLPPGHAQVACELIDFLMSEGKAEGGPSVEELAALILQYGTDAVVTEIERRAEMHGPWNGLEHPPAKVIGSGIRAGLKPKKKASRGAFKAWLARVESEIQKAADAASRAEWVQKALAFRETPREERLTIAKSYEANVQSLRYDFREVALVGEQMLAYDDYVKDVLAVLEWSRTDAGVAALAEGVLA